MRAITAESQGDGRLGFMQRAGPVSDGAGRVRGGAQEGGQENGSRPVIPFHSLGRVFFRRHRQDRRSKARA